MTLRRVLFALLVTVASSVGGLAVASVSQDRSRCKLPSGVGRGLLCALALLLLTVVTTATVAAQGAHLQTAASSSGSVQAADEPSERRLRAEGFTFALGSYVRLDLWLKSRSLADLIADSYATNYRIPRAQVLVPDVTYRAAVLSFDGNGFPFLSQVNKESPQDYDRISRCLTEPLRSLYPVGLPCDRPDSGCWEDLGEDSTVPGSPLFPLQLAIFLENAGYSVYISRHAAGYGSRYAVGQRRLLSVFEALETGTMLIWPTFLRPSPLPPSLRQPERSFTMDNIRLLDCKSVEE